MKQERMLFSDEEVRDWFHNVGPYLIAFPIGLLILCLAFYWGTFGHLGLSYKQEVWGQFGDFLGGVLNPVFSGVSLFALCITIAFQSREMQLTNTRHALAITESGLFQLFTVYDSCVSQLEFKVEGRIRGTTITLRGRDGLLHVANAFRVYAFDSQSDESPSGPTLVDCAARFSVSLSMMPLHYYTRCLKSVLRFIADSPSLTKEQRIHYTSLFTARLSTSDFALLLVLCLSPAERDFRILATQLDVFRHVSSEEVDVHGFTGEIRQQLRPPSVPQ